MQKSKDSLGNRIKQAYEDAYRITMPQRMPVIIRVDGCHFHSYTKGCQKPFDATINTILDETAIYLCKNMQNVALSYQQSDEISLLLINYKQLNTQSWHGNSIQKMVSVAAGLASAYFTSQSHRVFGQTKLANFDARAFAVPREDVNNAFLFRQQDATRNSIQSLARSLYSHKEYSNKNGLKLQQMIKEKGYNWNYLPVQLQRGRCSIKEYYFKEGISRSQWITDNNIPLFNQNTNYINKFVFPESEDLHEDPG